MKITSPLVRRLSLLAAAFLLVCTQLLLASPALANPGELHIDGGIIQREVRAGESFEHTFTVQSNPTDPDLEMTAEAAGFGQAPDGSYLALSVAEDANPRSARAFITSIDKPSFTLKPGPSGVQKINVSIKVPQNVTAGGYYAIIYIHSQPAGEGQVGVILAANIPVVLTVKGTGQANKGEITELKSGEVLSGQPIKINTVLKNTGNYHYKASNHVIITDGDGNQVTEASVPLTGASIIPGYTYRFEASLAVAGALEVGEYQIASEVISEDGTVIDSQKTALNIGASYSLFPGIDEDSLSILDFTTTGEDLELDARQKAGVDIMLMETIAGEHGRAIIGKYKTEPVTAIKFSIQENKGGTGQQAVKYVDVFIEGITKGTARINLYYSDEEMAGFDENSLLISYWNGQAWQKADNISVFTGANYISADIPIGQLSGTIIGFGGGGTTVGMGWLIWIIIVLAVIAVSIIVMVFIVRRKRLIGRSNNGDNDKT